MHDMHFFLLSMVIFIYNLQFVWNVCDINENYYNFILFFLLTQKETLLKYSVALLFMK